MFERPASGERAILVCVGLGRALNPTVWKSSARLRARRARRCSKCWRPPASRPIRDSSSAPARSRSCAPRVEALEADLVVIDGTLSPEPGTQPREELKCRVLDRSGLILDIFAQRARTFEGKLQVELAQLQHMSTRLVRGWTHLERQRGGGIGLRGPGETQLETDRRLIGKRIKTLNDRIEKVLRAARDHAARSASGAEVPTIALVGYTNAGKSTLFNRADAHADAYAADQLFATLDPTVRRLHLAPGLETALADTVGFVRDLPHELVAAFRSTLQEAREADLLLHVIDAADPERNDRIAQVDEVLRVDRRAGRAADRGLQQDRPHRRTAARGNGRGRSSSTGSGSRRTAAQGIDLLLQALHQRLGADLCRCVPADSAAGRPGAGAAVRRGCRHRAQDPRRRRRRGRDQPAPPGPRTNLPRGRNRTANGKRALCRRGAVPTIERLFGDPGCGVTADDLARAPGIRP